MRGKTYIFWRFIDWILGNSKFVWFVAFFIKAVESTVGEKYSLAILGKIGAFSSWPRNRKGWINLHVSRFRYQVRHKVQGLKQVNPKRPYVKPRNRNLKVGFVGPFSGLLGFPNNLFNKKPQDIDLYFFDIEYLGQSAGYLSQYGKSYHTYNLDCSNDYEATLLEAADCINKFELDLLVNAYYWLPAYDLISLITTPSIMNLCNGSDLFHHEKVDFQIYPQPEADFFVFQNHIYSGLARKKFSGQVVFPGFAHYDSRDIGYSNKPAWQERENLIVYHGSLYKLASYQFLSLVFDLMVEDKKLEFVFMGRGVKDDLSKIFRWAKDKNVSSRVFYEGSFVHLRNNEGVLEDPGWAKLKEYLLRARLAPNPWPIGGGFARFEAYLSGVPTAHMGVQFGAESWGKRQFSLLELPALLVPTGTATSLSSYKAICQKCLYDENFADQLVAEQFEVAAKIKEPAAWWHQLIGCYQDWLTISELVE